MRVCCGNAPLVLRISATAAHCAAGHSWCGDCVEAEPVIKAAVDEAESDIVSLASCVLMAFT
jgi:hypothetical protein